MTVCTCIITPYLNIMIPGFIIMGISLYRMAYCMYRMAISEHNMVVGFDIMGGGFCRMPISTKKKGGGFNNMGDGCTFG